MAIDHGTTLPDPQDLQDARQAADQATQENPQGGRAEPAAQPDQGASPQAAPPSGLTHQRVGPGRPQVLPMPQGDDALVFGPSDRPDEPGIAGAGLLAKRPAAPQNIHKYVPALMAAAQDPDAPPLIHNLVALLSYHLGEQ